MWQAPPIEKTECILFYKDHSTLHRGSDNPREETYMEKEKGNNRGRGEERRGEGSLCETQMTSGVCNMDIYCTFVV